MTDFDKDWIWIVHRADGTIDGGMIKTEEDADQYRKEDDEYFRVEKRIQEMPQEVTPASMNNEKAIIDLLVQLKNEKEAGEILYYHKVFLYGITHEKQYLIDGIRQIPNKYLKLRSIRYVYALYELSYMDKGIYLTADEFKKKLAETTKIKEDDKEAVYDAWSVGYYFKSDITEDEFKSAIDGVVTKYRYKKFDYEVLHALRQRRKGNLEGAEEHLNKYISAFINLDGRNHPISLSKKSNFAEDEYENWSVCAYDTFSSRLNQITGGGYKGELWIIGGYTSDGKSGFAKELAYKAMKDGANVLFVTLEMLEDEMNMIFQTRTAFDLGYTTLTLNKIRRRQLNDEELIQYKKVIDKMKEYKNLFIYQPEGKFTINDLELEIDRMQATMDLDVVVVDYIELLDPDRKYESVRIKVKESMRLAKKMATNKNILLITPHQVSRKGRERAEKRPAPYYTIDDLQESSGVEQNCAIVVWIYQDETLRDMDLAQVGVAKNRMGKLDIKGWQIKTDWEHCRIYDEGVDNHDRYEMEDDTELGNEELEWIDK